MMTAQERAENACQESLNVLVKRWRDIASTKADDLHPGYCLALKNCAAELELATELFYGHQ